MMLLEPTNRLDWFNNSKVNKREKIGAICQSSSQIGFILHYIVPKLIKRDLAKIEEALAMHYYLTRTSFARIEKENLLSAFRINQPDIVLSDRKKLGSGLLDNCYAKVKSVVNNRIEEMKLNACLTPSRISRTSRSSITC